MTNSATKSKKNPTGPQKAARPDKRPTKSDAVLKLLRSKNGASIEEITKATGWQAHSIRGFLSGTVKKRMGLAIENEPGKDGLRRYRIAEPAAAPAGQ